MTGRSKFGVVSRLAGWRGVRRVAGVTGAALLLQTAVALAPAEAKDNSAGKAKAAAELVIERPDAVSAMVTAKAQGARVENVAARTEYSTSFANHDGTWTTDTYNGQIRYRENGVLRDIDLTMAKNADGTIGPRGHASKLRLTGKTTGAVDEVATLAPGAGKQIALGWGKQLPEPVLEGAKAIYRDISPGGVDMVIEARRAGFEQTFVIRERPTGPMSWQVPLRTKGLTAAVEADGSVSFTDAKGTVAATIPAGIAWDAVVDPNTGDHVNTSPVTFAVAQKGKGKAVLTVTPDPVWLADPVRVLPLTIDPDYTIDPTFDAFVQQGITTNQGADSDLKLGNNGAGQKARSFLRFPTSSVHGVEVLSASLNLYMKHSWSCSARGWEVWETGRAEPSHTWTNQPGWKTKVATTSTTKGYSTACKSGWANVPITGEVARWAADTGTDAQSLGLRASDEVDPYGWKKFSSANGSQPPYVSVTYNRRPAATGQAGLHDTNPFGSEWFTADRTPRAWARDAVDPDGNNVRMYFEVHTNAQGTNRVSGCNVVVASGTQWPWCEMTETQLADGTYWLRAIPSDDRLFATAWTPMSQFTVAASAPAKPLISCPSHPHGSWSEQVPAAPVSCTITATGSGPSAPGYIAYSVDGAQAWTWAAITPSTDPNVAKIDVTLPNTPGEHVLGAVAATRAAHYANFTEHRVGYGSVGLSAPAPAPAAPQAMTGKVYVAASGPPAPGSALPAAELRWRIAGTANGEWRTAAAPAEVSLPVGAGGAGVSASGFWDVAKSLKAAAAAGVAGISERVPARIEVQVCLKYLNQTQARCTWDGSAASLQYVPHAFGNGYPVADAGGAGQVALWTGEFATSATDVSVPGYTGSLSISRSHSTFAAPAGPSGSVFGPGWSAHLDGPDAGIAGWRVIDNTHLDGTIALMDGAGDALVYATPDGMARTGANLPETNESGGREYEPVDDATALAGARIKVTGTGSDTRIEFISEDATITAFTATTAPGVNTTGAPTAGVFAPAWVREPGTVGKTSFDHDGAGRVTRIVAPAPPGVDCANPQTTKGCRSLALSYTSVPTPQGPQERLTAVTLHIWDPKAGTAGEMVARQVAAYAYDSAGRLATATETREGLSTGYSYDGESRLASITPPGLEAIRFGYTSEGVVGGGLAELAELATVKRDLPGGGESVLGSYVYNVPVAGGPASDAQLPNLSASQVAEWGQLTGVPTYAAAVFGPAHPANAVMPGAHNVEDWKHAAIFYADDFGYTVNTATHAPDAGDHPFGGWQVDATGYDERGNVIRQVEPAVLAKAARGELGAGAVDLYATATVYGPDQDLTDATGKVLTAAKSRLIHAEGPSRQVRIDGQSQLVRPRTAYDYDQGAPGDGEIKVHPGTGLPYNLVTTTTVTAREAGTGAKMAVLSTTATGYASDGDAAAGWKLGLPTKVITDMDGDGPDGDGEDITRLSRYDSEGRVIETRQPDSAAGGGNDPGTRKITYYSAGSDPQNCQASEWAGLVCQVAPGDGAASALPTTRYTSYDAFLAPTKIEESAGGATRTTTTTYTDQGWVEDLTTSASGLPGSEPVSGTRTKYDPATGLATELIQLEGGQQSAAKDVTGYDSWGRVTSYRPADASQATGTEYDSAGRVRKVTDPKGATTWTYGGTDALNRTDLRGLPTKVTVTNPGGADLVFTGAYNAEGALEVQTLPGGITQRTRYDDLGQDIGLAYCGQVTPAQCANGEGTWLSWGIDRDLAGRVRAEHTPDGTAFTGTTGSALAYAREYTYDPAGRLTTVKDRTNAATGTTLDLDDPASMAAACQTRTYKFDRNGNRETLTRHGADETGACATIGTEETTAWTYNGADQITRRVGTQGEYTYDAFGRASTIPAADSPNGSRPGSTAGELSIGYYDTDAVHTLAQNGVTTTYTLDVLGRRHTATTDGPSGQTLTRRYTDTGDNPAWIENSATGAVTRYPTSLGGDLSATITTGGAADGVRLALANPHGDTVTTVDVPTGANATSINPWSDYDEYGSPRNAESANTNGGPAGYGWLGAKERATDDTGLMLMGARLYNPTTGQFTSLDPVYGGNETAYSYPGDPVNMYDLDGRLKCWKVCGAAKKAVSNPLVRGFVAGAGAGAICAFTAGVGCVVMAGMAIGAGLSAVNYRVNTASRSGGGYARSALGGAVEGFGAAGLSVGRAKHLRHMRVPKRTAPRHAMGRPTHARPQQYTNSAGWQSYVKANGYINKGMY